MLDYELFSTADMVIYSVDEYSYMDMNPHFANNATGKAIATLDMQMEPKRQSGRAKTQYHTSFNSRSHCNQSSHRSVFYRTGVVMLFIGVEFGSYACSFSVTRVLQGAN